MAFYSPLFSRPIKAPGSALKAKEVPALPVLQTFPEIGFFSELGKGKYSGSRSLSAVRCCRVHTKLLRSQGHGHPRHSGHSTELAPSRAVLGAWGGHWLWMWLPQKLSAES